MDGLHKAESNAFEKVKMLLSLGKPMLFFPVKVYCCDSIIAWWKLYPLSFNKKHLYFSYKNEGI